ncbi:MAG: hypothetical protein IIB42_08635 [Candidatus Marinimicrobia bacterium]|nr:hypothetical protein [Candidatus Neomarinimicrobiota bacterium]
MSQTTHSQNIFSILATASFSLLLVSGLFMACEKEVEVIVHDTVEVQVMVEIITVDTVVAISDPVEGGGSLDLTAKITAGSGAGALTYAWFATAGDFDDAAQDTVTWNAPDDSGAVTITVHATDGTYIGIGSTVVGVGMYAPTATEWYVGAATCGQCHTSSGTASRNKYTAWQGSAHALAFEDSRGPSCEPCHTVGVNGLDVAIEGDAGYDDAPIATYQNVQCESCHGRGSTHADPLSMAATDISISYDPVESCGDCHSGGHNPQLSEWQASVHANPTSYPMGSSSCQGCHEGVAAAERLSGDLSTFYASGSIDRTGGVAGRTEPDNIGFVCATCHDPHGGANEHQIRTIADVQLVEANGVVPAPITAGGSGKLCMQCHHARRGPDAQVVDGYSHFGPHGSPQADMLTGHSAYHGVADASFAWAQPTHAGLEETCVTCHMVKIEYDTVFPDSAYSGHQFDSRPAACAPCHGDISSFDDIMAWADFDGNGTVEGVEDEVHGLLDLLADSLIARFADLGVDTSAAAGFDLEHALGEVIHYFYDATDTVIVDSVMIPQVLRESGYNLVFVEADGSHGMHNADYAIQLLQQSIKKLTGSLPAGTAPLVPRGRMAVK